MMQTVYIVSTISINEEKNLTEFKISQEAYSTLEKAQEFCSSRSNVIKVDEFNYETIKEDEYGWFYKYSILFVYVK